MTLPSTLTRGLDLVLDRSVVLGYSRVGPAVRRTWWPSDPAPDALAGTVVAITGANSGLGKATALGAVRLGGEVRMLCRDLARGESAREDIVREVPGAVLHVDRCDVSDLGSLRQVAADLAREVPRLRALVHNAGIMPPRRTETPDGHEETLAVHVLGPHILTDALRGPLAADGKGRVVFVVSGGMYTQRLDLDDPEYTRGDYSPTVAYARTKRMEVHLAEAWARELAPEGVAAHSTHPGWADTPGVQTSLPRFARLMGPLLRSPGSGAETTVWLMASPEGHETSGLFWHDRSPRPTNHLARPTPSEEEVRRLWDYVVETTGVPGEP
ncbi:MAG TPA: SDR family NAD(P)-dependent oxidoreductase [Nocardioidaceae bacterium]